jgi:mono/diheme cytochrome c family protein
MIYRFGLTGDAGDEAAREQFQQLMQSLSAKSADANPYDVIRFSDGSPSNSLSLDNSPGMKLYRRHCAACHGEKAEEMAELHGISIRGHETYAKRK